MHASVKHKFHTRTECGLKFLPLYHTSCMRGYSNLLNKDRLLRVLYPVRRSITTLDCVLFKVSNLVFVVELWPEIGF